MILSEHNCSVESEDLYSCSDPQDKWGSDSVSSVEQEDYSASGTSAVEGLRWLFDPDIGIGLEEFRSNDAAAELSRKIGSKTKEFLKSTADTWVKNNPTFQEGMRLFDEILEEAEKQSTKEKMVADCTEQANYILTFKNNDEFRNRDLPTVFHKLCKDLQTFQDDHELKAEDIKLFTEAITFGFIDKIKLLSSDVCSKGETILSEPLDCQIETLGLFGFKFSTVSTESQARFMTINYRFLDINQVFACLERDYSLWKFVLDRRPGQAKESDRIKSLRDVLKSEGLFVQEMIENADVSNVSTDLVFLAVALQETLKTEDCYKLLFDGFCELYRQNKKVPVALRQYLRDSFLSWFSKFYGQGDPAQCSDRILPKAKVTRQERFVWYLASRKSGAYKVGTFKQINFWTGYYFALKDCPELKWKEVDTVLRFGSVDILRKLGYLTTVCDCEKSVQANITTSKQAISMEDLLIACLKSKGPISLKPLLDRTLPNLEKGSLSPKFYQYYIYLKLISPS